MTATAILNSVKQPFYTYIHIRADNGKVFYVGKGKGKRSHAQHGRNPYWHKIVKKHGLQVEIAARWETELEAFEHETFLITCFREINHPLCNMTDGGEGRSGYALTNESKLKISKSNSGKKRTLEQNKRNSDMHKGVVQSAETIAKRVLKLAGKKRSAEAIAKISAGHMGKQISAEHRAKISAGNKGRIRSDEFKAKVSAGLTGRPCGEETRKKISEKHKGRVITQEQREKISKTLTGGKLSLATRAKLQAWADNPERKARHSAATKGRPWSDARRAAVKGVPWSEERRDAQDQKSKQLPLI